MYLTRLPPPHVTCIFKKIELLANLSTIVAAPVNGTVLVKRYLLPDGRGTAAPSTTRLRPGTLSTDALNYRHTA